MKNRPLQISEADYDKLQKIAAQERRTLKAQFSIILSQFLEKNQKK